MAAGFSRHRGVLTRSPRRRTVAALRNSRNVPVGSRAAGRRSRMADTLGGVHRTLARKTRADGRTDGRTRTRPGRSRVRSPGPLPHRMEWRGTAATSAAAPRIIFFIVDCSWFVLTSPLPAKQASLPCGSGSDVGQIPSCATLALSLGKASRPPASEGRGRRTRTRGCRRRVAPSLAASRPTPSRHVAAAPRDPWR